MSNINISGLADTNANGGYVNIGLFNGYAYYKNSNGYLVIYHDQLLPYTKNSGYFIMKYSIMNGSIGLYVPKYVNFSTDISSDNWYSLMGDESGENDIEFLIDFVSSSSSNSSASIVLGDLWNGSISLIGNEFTSIFSGAGEIVYGVNSASILNRENLTSLECYETILDGELDISNCTSLEYLDFDTTDLSSVNVTGCSSLVDIYGYRCKLTSFDLTGCSSLANLYLGFNLLTSLDISNCLSLVELVTENNTSLTSIDLTGLTLLDTVHMPNNNLTSINISGLSSINSFRVNDNINLSSIVLSGNNIISNFEAENCALSSTEIDNIFITINSYNTSGFRHIKVGGGSNAAPTEESLAARTALSGRGWTLTFNS